MVNLVASHAPKNKNESNQVIQNVSIKPQIKHLTTERLTVTMFLATEVVLEVEIVQHNPNPQPRHARSPKTEGKRSLRLSKMSENSSRISHWA